MIAFRDLRPRALSFGSSCISIRMGGPKNRPSATAGISGVQKTPTIMRQALVMRSIQNGFDCRSSVPGSTGGARGQKHVVVFVFLSKPTTKTLVSERQRADPGGLYNTTLSCIGESIRLFPSRIGPSSPSGSTIQTGTDPGRSPLFSRSRPWSCRGCNSDHGRDDRFPLAPGERPEMESVPIRNARLLIRLTRAIGSRANYKPLDHFARQGVPISEPAGAHRSYRDFRNGTQ